MNQKQRDEILVGLLQQSKKRDKAIKELSKQGKKTDKILQKLIERENTRDKMLLKIYEEQQKIKEDAPYDAICIFDADNIVDKNFLKAMNKKLCQGEEVVQGYKDKKNP